MQTYFCPPHFSAEIFLLGRFSGPMGWRKETGRKEYRGHGKLCSFFARRRKWKKSSGRNSESSPFSFLPSSFLHSGVSLLHLPDGIHMYTCMSRGPGRYGGEFLPAAYDADAVSACRASACGDGRKVGKPSEFMAGAVCRRWPRQRTARNRHAQPLCAGSA
jgi:hypothetical protein